MSMFDRDLLYEIADKILCAVDEFRVDLREAAKFMLINNDCKNAFLAQFSKMKCVDIFFRIGGMEVNLYKDKNYQNRGFDLEHKGPYATNSAFIDLLMQHDRFRPRSIYISDVFSSRADAVEEVYSFPSSELAPLQVLATILNLKKFCAPSESYLLDSVQFHETKGCMMDLCRALSLNARETSMELQIDGYHCGMNSSNNVNVSAGSIRTLSVTFNSHWDSQTDDNEAYTEFPHEEWMGVLGAIFAACTSLKRLKVRVNLSDSYDGCMNLLAVRLQKSIDSITKVVLPMIYKTNPPPVNSSVEIEFCGFLNFLVIQDIPVNEYDLFKFGEKEPADEGEVVRAAKFDRDTLRIVGGGGDCYAAAKNTMDTKKSLDDLPATNEEEEEDEVVEPGCVVRFAIYRYVDEDSDVERQMLEDVLDYSDYADQAENEDFDGDEDADVIDYYAHDLDDVEEYYG